ncbi:unnamed protein product [Moneuplotes crassus]|uniref:START domain-containing protein n=1 Tax=Euplotes crassus TaxID=5936 RepID=A0AAD1XZI8_EUPCR|nr:unnamed protein product [Moneuplotes crassus]
MEEDAFAAITDETKRQQAEKAKEKGDGIFAFANSDGWEKYDEKDGITVYTMKSESGLNCVKGEGVLNFNSNVIEDFAFQSETKPKCDDGCEESSIIESFGDDIKFEYLRYKGKLLVSGRDFVNVSVKYVDSEGRSIISAYSVPHPDKPEQDGYVRGDVKTAGWIITPDKDNEDKSHVVYVTEIDFAGSLPTALVNSVNTKQGFFIAKLAEELKKEFE